MYTVKLCSVPLPRPFSLTVHTFFLVSDGKTEHRYEIWMKPDASRPESPYIQVDFYSDPQVGGRKTLFENVNHPAVYFPTEILVEYSGDAGSVADRLYQVIVTSPQQYPYKDRYFLLPGPNSNTYVQWAIDQVSDCDFTLPWNAFGKGFANRLK